MTVFSANEEVLYTTEPIVLVTAQDIRFLKAKAVENSRRRIRLCAHPNVEDGLHEMLIVHPQRAYVRPHKHPGKSESFHMIEGELDVVILDDSGQVTDLIHMGDFSSGETFYYRLSTCCFHTVIPLSEQVVFHETTNGPFNPEGTVFAPWAPPETDQPAVASYLNDMTDRVAAHCRRRSDS